jgi:hypothetical protein
MLADGSTPIARSEASPARAEISWEECTPVYLLQPTNGLGSVLMVEPVDHDELRAGDQLAVHMHGDCWMLTQVVSIGGKSITVGTSEHWECWGVNKDRRLFDAMVRVIGRPASHRRIVRLRAHGILHGYTLNRGGHDALVGRAQSSHEELTQQR